MNNNYANTRLGLGTKYQSPAKTTSNSIIRGTCIAVCCGIGALGSALCGLNDSDSQAQEVQPGGKGPKGQPGAKGPGGMKGQPGNGGGFGFPGGGIEAVKAQIKATDEEWKVIGPKLREVVAARRAAEIGTGVNNQNIQGFFGGPGGGGFGPPGGGGGFGPPGGGGGFGPPGGPGGFGPPGGPGGGGPGGGGAQGLAGPNSPPSFLDALTLSADQKSQLDTLQKELENKLAKVLNEDQNRQLKDIREGRGGFGVPAFTGQILFPTQVQRLNLTVEQKPQVEIVLKEIDTKLAKILSEEQNKRLAGIRETIGRIGPGQPPSFGQQGPPRFGGGTPGLGGGISGGDSATNQALNELQAAIDDPKTSSDQLNEKVTAVRAARKKAREKLEAAQKELFLLITPDQEAVLVRLGYLD